MRPWRSSAPPTSASTARAVGHVERGGLGAPARGADRAHGVGGMIAARRRDDVRAARRQHAARSSRPMPRDAPVTIATLPRRSNMGENRVQIVGRAEGEDVGVLVNLLDQSAQHASRAHLNIRGDAFRRKAMHDVLPQHRAPTPAARARRSPPPPSRFGSASTLATIGHARAAAPRARAAPAPAAPRPASSARSGTARSPAAAPRAWRRAPSRARPRAAPPRWRRQ